MNPVENDPLYNYFGKFVYQDDVRFVQKNPPPTKPFNIDPPAKTEKSKKDLKKKKK